MRNGFPSGPYLKRDERDMLPAVEQAPSGFCALRWRDSQDTSIEQLVPFETCLDRALGFATFARAIEIEYRPYAVRWTWRAKWLRNQSPMGATIWLCPDCGALADYGFATPPLYDCDHAKERTK